MLNMDREDFERKVNSGEAFSLIYSMPGDEVTPISIFLNLNGSNRFLLESAFMKESKGRYSYMGCNPCMKIQSREAEVTIEHSNGVKESFKGDVLKVLKEHVHMEANEHNCDLPFIGGAVGYLGYDAVRSFESIPDDNMDELQVPDSSFNIYDTIICYDHFKNIVQIIYQVFKNESRSFQDIVEHLEDVKANIMKPGSMHEMNKRKTSPEYSCNTTKDKFEEAVESARSYIKKGDIFQVVLSQRLSASIDEHPFEVFRRLRSLNPSPYLFYIEFDGFTAAGASPESLVKTMGSTVETNPIAGTRPRGKDKIMDEIFKKELVSDEKERAEHLMLVDLGRNDIGKVSKFGSVKLQRFMEVDCYSHVMHLVSNVSGEMKKEHDCFDALRACFPAGTVSGAPKIRAMEIIDELEQVRRGIYAGAVGYFSYNGDMDTCIAIRTIVFKNNKAYIQAGAGIVYDSQKTLEYEETINKLKALLEAI